MSQDTKQLEDALLAVADSIFESLFVPDDEQLRREVIQMVLRSGRMVDYMGQKDQLITAALDGSIGAKIDPFEMMRSRLVLPMGLGPADRSVMTASTPDIDLQFVEAGHSPHARAAAVRAIQYHRAFSLVSHHLGTVLDIGGNYAKHTRNATERKFDIHSCTKAIGYDEAMPTVLEGDEAVESGANWIRQAEGELEHHRQTQRDVSLAIAGFDSVNRCVNGAEHCDVQARHGVCVQSLYDIDPALWVQIFRKHGLEYVPCFFHYDVDMEVEDVGYMPKPGMHWARVDDNHIQAHFEGDSSHPYIHRRDWWLKYGSSWMLTEDDWEYVLYYEVEYINQGDAKASFIRLRKDTLGYSEPIAQFRFIDIEQFVDVTVPKFDPSLGKPVKDPLAYTAVPIRVSMALFSHVMRFGISNDTERSDLPLTHDRVKDQCHTFNHVRRVSGTAITVPYRLDTVAVNDTALGMYLLIVKRAAMNQAKYVAYTENMKRVQRRWGDESVVKLTAKAVAAVTLAPFIMLAESFSEVVDLMAVSMRQQVVDELVVMHGEDVTPYRIMKPIRTVSGSRTEFLGLDDHGMEPVQQKLPDQIEPQQFYDTYKDTMSPEHRQRVEEYLASVPKTVPVADVQQEESDVVEPVVAADDEDGPQDTGDANDREKWLIEYDKLQDELELVQLPPRNPLDHSFDSRTDNSKVWVFARQMVREYQLYNIDVALHILEDAKELCHKTWGAGRPRSSEIRDLNIQLDVGIHYFRVVDGEIMDMTRDDRYAYVIDPWTRMHLPTYVKSGKCKVNGAKSDVVFTCESLRIFNMFTIATRARDMLQSSWTIQIPAILVDGVPGCGKTYNIIQMFTIRDVLLTTVRETRDATYEEMIEQEKFKDYADILKNRIRTADSANCRAPPHARTLYVDEGLMAHPGVIVMAIRDTKPKSVKVFGDSTQIGFIDRGSKIGNMHLQSLFYWTQIIEMNETIRCPADATWVSAQFYPEERRARIKTCSPFMRSITFEHVPDQKDVAWTNVTYPWVGCSVQRADRDELISRDTQKFAYGPTYVKGDKRVPVYSVHEVQGRTKPLVLAVRISPFNNAVTESKPHSNVMFTRHTLRMKYRSSCGPDQDVNAKYAKMASELPEEELRKWMIPTPTWLQERMMKRHDQYSKYMN